MEKKTDVPDAQTILNFFIGRIGSEVQRNVILALAKKEEQERQKEEEETEEKAKEIEIKWRSRKNVTNVILSFLSIIGFVVLRYLEMIPFITVFIPIWIVFCSILTRARTKPEERRILNRKNIINFCLVVLCALVLTSLYLAEVIPYLWILIPIWIIFTLWVVWPEKKKRKEKKVRKILNKRNIIKLLSILFSIFIFVILYLGQVVSNAVIIVSAWIWLSVMLTLHKRKRKKEKRKRNFFYWVMALSLSFFDFIFASVLKICEWFFFEIVTNKERGIAWFINKIPLAGGLIQGLMNMVFRPCYGIRWALSQFIERNFPNFPNIPIIHGIYWWIFVDKYFKSKAPKRKKTEWEKNREEERKKEKRLKEAEKMSKITGSSVVILEETIEKEVEKE